MKSESHVPRHIREAVERWSEKLTKAGRTKEDIDNLFSDADWPTVVLWSRDYSLRSREAGGRRVQRKIRELHNLQTNFALYSFIYKVRDTIAGRLKQLFAITQDRVRIDRPPAGILLRVGRFLLTHDAYTRYIESYVADIHHEYYAALQAGEYWRAQWVVWRGYWRVLAPLRGGLMATLRALLQLWF